MLVNQKTAQHGMLVELVWLILLKRCLLKWLVTCPVKILLVEVAVGVRLEFLFLFCLEDVMFRFYLLK